MVEWFQKPTLEQRACALTTPRCRWSPSSTGALESCDLADPGDQEEKQNHQSRPRKRHALLILLAEDRQKRL